MNPMLDPVHAMRPGVLQLSSLPPLSLYVHLPWCIKKCPYCDFNSHEQAKDGVQEQRYIDAVIADLEAALPLIWGRNIHSIFIGGGTPSLFSPESIDRLLGDIRARLRLEADCEITMEANPGTFEKDRFRAFRQAGVTRLSIGVQSFDDAQLKALGRVHDGAQARAALDLAPELIDVARLHLLESGLQVDYRLQPVEALAAEAPDLEASLEEREIGGLGIHLPVGHRGFAGAGHQQQGGGAHQDEGRGAGAFHRGCRAISHGPRISHAGTCQPSAPSLRWQRDSGSARAIHLYMITIRIYDWRLILIQCVPPPPHEAWRQYHRSSLPSM